MIEMLFFSVFRFLLEVSMRLRIRPILVFTLLACSIFSPVYASQATQIAQTQSDTVYVTHTGKKYHRDGCRSLSRSRVPIKRSDAIAKGYTACMICKP
jgi:hypothetical protein